MTHLADHSAALSLATKQASEDIEAAGFRLLFKQPTGSAFYGKPDPGDFDVLVLIREDEFSGRPEGMPIRTYDGMPGRRPDDMLGFIEAMKPLGYADCGEDGNTSGGNSDEGDYHGLWCALRREFAGKTLNILATTDVIWYYRQAAATALCRQLAQEFSVFPSKETFVGVFRAVREGVNPFTGEKED